jgi:LuxR family maltose regulon positive regulatory protein
MLEDAHAARELLAESSPLGVGALLCAGFAELLTGDTAAAEASLRATADRAAQLGVPAGASVALAVLSLQAASGGDLDAAERHARRAADVVSRGGLERHVSASIVHAAVARAALVQRRVSTAQRATQLADPLVRSTTYALPWFASYVRLELAQVQLALGESGSARELLAGAEDVVARRPGLGLIEDRIVSLRRDLRFGRTVADGSTTTLTAAELRLLPLLPSYLSFREIADRLGISRNTVKTQAISVYRKLGVKSRTAVVERAQTLGLLDSKSAQADNG